MSLTDPMQGHQSQGTVNWETWGRGGGYASRVSTPVQRRTLTLFYVLDVSGSMKGPKIAQLNAALKNTVSVVKTEAAKNAMAQIQIAVLSFSTTCQWMHPEGPVSAESFVWNDLKAGGMTNVAPALNELDDKLSEDKFLKARRGHLPPVIIFMTDGYATDSFGAIEDALTRAHANREFADASFVGFPLGKDADRDLVERIVGKGHVIDVDDMEQFASAIAWVSRAKSHAGGTQDVFQPGGQDLDDVADDWDPSGIVI